MEYPILVIANMQTFLFSIFQRSRYLKEKKFCLFWNLYNRIKKWNMRKILRLKNMKMVQDSRVNSKLPVFFKIIMF